MDERGWQTIAWCVAAVVAVLLGVRMLGSSSEPPTVRVGPGSAHAVQTGGRAARADPSGPFVHVTGAVRRPGVYRLREGVRVIGGLRRAGGPTDEADLTAINLAAPLRDGQQVVVPLREPGTVSAAAGGGGEGAPIGLGSASAEDLDRLDGIGPTLAARIVEYREQHGGFGSVDELGEVEGIGEKRLEALEQALNP